MHRYSIVLLVLMTVGSSSQAVIKKLTPLSEVLQYSMILPAEVDKVDPQKPAVVFKLGTALKGKPPAEKIILSLVGDSFAKKDKHTEIMLDRLEAGRKLILFLSPLEEDFVGFGYLEGTWFQLRGVTTDGKTVWRFLHCEPYFRRTYQGTTEELRALLANCLAGKAKPPEPDEKVPHGYGPPVQKNRCDDSLQGRLPPAGFFSGGLFAVIPSVVLVGPLAILSALFPSLFAGLASGLKRWRAFLIIASFNSLLTGAIALLRELKWLPETVLLSDSALTLVLLASTLLGVAWADRRYRRDGVDDPEVTHPPRRNDLLQLILVLALFCGILAGVAGIMGLTWADLFRSPTREMTSIGIGLIFATLYSTYRILTRAIDEGALIRLSLPSEAVALGGMILVILVTALRQPASQRDQARLTQSDAVATLAVAPQITDARVLFDVPEAKSVYSGLCITPDRIYLGVVESKLAYDVGAVLAFDRKTLQRVWKYTDKNLKYVYSTPVYHAGKLYVGEGLHTDSDCRMICLDAEKGTKIWEKVTASHTEGTPAISEGNVFFSAGDDGIYCCNADTGAEVWHYPGYEQKIHIDTSVIIQDGKVYAGSGYNTLAALCLDARTGKELWRQELPQRSFGTPLILGDAVIYGVGTGNLSEDLSSEPEPDRPKETAPAGTIVSLDRTSGTVLWKYGLPKSVHTQLVADARAIYACCKDGSVHAVDRVNGQNLWKIQLAQEFSTGPVLATYARGTASIALYVCSRDGFVYSLDPQTGRIFWMRPLLDAVQRRGEVSSPMCLLARDPEGISRTLLIPANLTQSNGQTYPGVVEMSDEVRDISRKNP